MDYLELWIPIFQVAQVDGFKLSLIGKIRFHGQSVRLVFLFGSSLNPCNGHFFGASGLEDDKGHVVLRRDFSGASSQLLSNKSSVQNNACLGFSSKVICPAEHFIVD